MTNVTAREAMAHAEAAHDKIEAHEDLCAERYSHIHTLISGVEKTVGNILRILAWGGSTLFVLTIAVLGFLAARAIDDNDAETKELRDQLQRLEMRAAQSPQSLHTER